MPNQNNLAKKHQRQEEDWLKHFQHNKNAATALPNTYQAQKTTTLKTINPARVAQANFIASIADGLTITTRRPDNITKTTANNYIRGLKEESINLSLIIQGAQLFIINQIGSEYTWTPRFMTSQTNSTLYTLLKETSGPLSQAEQTQSLQALKNHLENKPAGVQYGAETREAVIKTINDYLSSLEQETTPRMSA